MKLIIVFVALCSEEILGVKRYEGHKVFQVEPSTKEQIDALLKLEQDEDDVSFLTMHKKDKPSDVLVGPDAIDKFEDVMKEEDIPYKVSIDNFQAALNSELSVKSRSLRSDGSPSHDTYYRYDEIINYIEGLEEEYSSMVSVETIGQTSEGRDLEVIKICSDGCGSKPTIFVDCGIHAREWLAPAMCVYLIQQLVENDDNSYMLEETDWYIIPVLNPDGYEFSHTDDRMWRKTRSKRRGRKCRGVDSNRNFDYHWDVVGTSHNPCKDTYSGTKAFSEPETQAFRDFVLEHKDYLKLYISFHTYGQYILYSWGWSTDLPDNVDELDDLGNDVADAIEAVRGTKYTVGSPAIVMYPSAGGSDDWVKGVAGVTLSYTIELPGSGFNGFISHPKNILPVVKETFEGIKVFHNYIADNYSDESG